MKGKYTINRLSFKDEFKLLPAYRDSTEEIDGYARKSQRKAKEHNQHPTDWHHKTQELHDVSFRPLYHARLKITEAKYRHLQELKLSIPTDYHLVYDSLPV